MQNDILDLHSNIFKLIFDKAIYKVKDCDHLHSNIFKLISIAEGYAELKEENLHSNIFKLILNIYNHLLLRLLFTF